MKVLSTFLSLILGLIISTTGLAESASGKLLTSCEYPEQPTIPDGLNASENELIATQKIMKAYLAEGDTYLACISELEKSWGADVNEEQKAVLVIFHNKIVDDMQEIAERFNTAVRAFKGRKK